MRFNWGRSWPSDEGRVAVEIIFDEDDLTELAQKFINHGHCREDAYTAARVILAEKRCLAAQQEEILNG